MSNIVKAPVLAAAAPPAPNRNPKSIISRSFLQRGCLRRRTGGLHASDVISMGSLNTVCRCQAVEGVDSQEILTGSSSDLPASGALENLWRSVGGPLLSIGKAGVKESHMNGLRDLLASHDAVKVKISRVVDLEEKLKDICDKTDSVVLLTKGTTVMFCKGQADLEELSASAEKDLLVKKENKEAKKASKQTGVTFPTRTVALFKSMDDRGILRVNDFDTNSRRMLSKLTEDEQSKILVGVRRRDLKNVRNRSAWLTTRIKMYLQSQSS